VREGLRYALSVPVLRTLLTMMAIVGTLQYNFQVILPVLAKETFSGDARTLGFMGAVLGIGMFCGSLGTAAFGQSNRKTLITSGFALGAVTLLVAISPTLWVAALVMIPLGAASMVFLTTMNSTLQLTAADTMRGRVMAIYFVLFLGSTPIGAPIVGWVAETFNARASLALGGFATIAACFYGYLKLKSIAVDESGDAKHIAERDSVPDARLDRESLATR
jgi:MFS family permease